MAAPNELAGLKIAVSAFISLSVILSVAVYFLYSAYSSAEVRLRATLNQNQQLSRSQTLLQKQYDELKTQMSNPP
jgi:hypothetical protein